ncbi:MAG: bifunctional DNA-formamidopyrimidine glycosylase/DNA-(apurinic or apyrimidinic site) lyase [Candidatus Daviesbacteria bacterium]|nr:bifunctional DNA-formamidopyrimidine glycosylase/DNA-(apurinic or apyrimidinic site) lyase [Candidatus Daviesbacteria bacterium]
MPELPEVEIIKLGLQKKIIGLKIQKIQILSEKSFIGNPDLAQGKNVLKIWRKAKILGVDLSSHSGAKRSEAIESRSYRSANASLQDDKNAVLLFHLKMTGQLIYEDGKRMIGGHPTEDMLGKMPNSHTRVIFSFSDGSHLYFNDQRRFGWVKIVDRRQATVDSLFKKLGPEPLEKDFTWQVLKQNLLRHKSMPVKAAIMDQSVLSGVGNIYSNEACFNAKIDPRKKVGDMKDREFKALHSGIIKALRDGIAHGGSTRAHFVDPEGHKGYFLDYAKVYGKEGYSCQGCKGKIRKITLAGRGTYFCPACQR